MYKILHFADLHLDSSFAGTGMISSIAKKRREELRSVLKRIIKLSQDLKVDAISVAGDLYEHNNISPDTSNFLKAQFASIAPLPVLISPGNHDPLLPGCQYHHIEWSSNVFKFCSPQLSSYPLFPGITLWGAAHNSLSFRYNVLENFKVQGEGTHILLLHGSDTSCIPPGKDIHCPFTPDQITQAGFHFALLGHYHKASLSPKDRPIMVYPGDPEPLGFDECGSHSVCLLEIQDNHISASLIPVNSVNYKVTDVDVSKAFSIEDIKQSINRESVENHFEHFIMKVILKGSLNTDVDLDVDSIHRDCDLSFEYLNIINETYPAYDFAAIRNEPTVKGAFVKKMLQQIEVCTTEDERVQARHALVYGLQALDGRKEIEPL